MGDSHQETALTVLIDISDQVQIEFKTLRKEIEAAKVWEVRLLVGGLIGFPAAFEWVQKAKGDLSFITWFLPVGIVVLSFLVGFIRWSAMRCGQYIREVLEPHFPLGGGWESWREKVKIRRRSEVLLVHAFLILIIVYYGVATWISATHVKAEWPRAIPVAAALYLVGFLLTIVFAWTPTSTIQLDQDKIPLSRIATCLKNIWTRLRKPPKSARR